MKIGDSLYFVPDGRPAARIPCRVVSFDDDTVCVAFERETFDGGTCHELRWEPRAKFDEHDAN